MPTQLPVVSACARFLIDGWGAWQRRLKNWLRRAAAGNPPLPDK